MIRVVHPGSDLDPDPDFLGTHRGSSGQKGTGSQIPDPEH